MVRTSGARSLSLLLFPTPENGEQRSKRRRRRPKILGSKKEIRARKTLNPSPPPFLPQILSSRLQGTGTKPPTLLRRVSLGRAIASAAAASASCPESYRQGICGSTFHCREFATKAKKKSKSSGTDSGEENMSKKDLALHQAIDQITSSFGKGAIMWLGRSEGHREVPVVSTGSFSLDMALGIGGLRKGCVVEVYGPEASGKTTLALHVIAEAQKLGGGGYCAFVDAEHALDPSLAEAIGVDTSNLLLSQPDSAEQALSLVDTLIRSGSVDVVVVDSVAALVPKTELDGEMGDAHVALQARLMSQALRKLSHSLSLSQTILLFINQGYSTTFGGFGGPKEVTSGGNALKFYASVRLNIRRVGLVKKGEETIGSQVNVKIVKNKHAPPFRTAQFELEFGKGICRSSEVFELCLKHKLVKKTGGSYYSFNEQQFHGKDALKSFLTANESVAKELEAELRRLIEVEAPKKEEEAEDDLLGDLGEETVRPETSSEEDLAALIEA